jgi:Icc protein
MLTRRDALRTGGLLSVAGILGASGGRALGAVLQGQGGAPLAPKGRLLRFAHLTDSHCMPERKAGAGLGACLAHLMAQPDRPELVITGGDLINDAFGATEKRTRTQWDLYTKTLRDGTSLPVMHCLGNHDIWGWNKSKAKVKGDEANWGKKWAGDLLGTPWYYAADRNGVKIIVLDSVHPLGEDKYKGGIDDAQFQWLSQQLASTPATTPIVIISHIPILNMAVTLTDGNWGDDGQSISAGGMIMDAPRLVRLFESHPNVKLCVSGHIHVLERLDMQGVSYICGGAVSGSWWRSPADDRKRRETREAAEGKPLPRIMRANPGYTIYDIFADGTFAYQYCEYGWKFDPAEQGQG